MASGDAASALNILDSRAPWRTRLSEFWFRHRSLIGFVFILPWFLSFVIFDLMPFAYNLYLSFTDYQIGTVGIPPWLGLENYIEIFTEDKLFTKSLGNTVYYLGFSVPLRLLFAFLWVKPSLIILSLWSFGGQMIIFLAGLQSIPNDLYEAAAIDGGNSWHRLRHITIPLMTPTIFFNLLIGVIGGFQVFTQVFILLGVNGGPLQSGLVFMLHVYNKAFRDFEFGYAAALSVILFSIIFVLTIALVYTSNRWVFYGDGGEDET